MSAGKGIGLILPIFKPDRSKGDSVRIARNMTSRSRPDRIGENDPDLILFGSIFNRLFGFPEYTIYLFGNLIVVVVLPPKLSYH